MQSESLLNSIISSKNTLIIDKDELPKSISVKVTTIYIVADSEELIKKRVLPILRVRQRFSDEFTAQIYRINALETLEKLPLNHEEQAKKMLQKNSSLIFYNSIADFKNQDNAFLLAPQFDDIIIDKHDCTIFHLDQFSETMWHYIVSHQNIKILLLDCEIPAYIHYIPAHIKGVFYVGNSHKEQLLKDRFKCANTKETESFSILSADNENFKLKLFIKELQKRLYVIKNEIIQASDIKFKKPEGDEHSKTSHTNVLSKLDSHGINKRKRTERNNNNNNQASDSDEDYVPSRHEKKS